MQTQDKIRLEIAPQPEIQLQNSRFIDLFSLAQPFEYLLMTIGTLAAMSNGALFAVYYYLWGNINGNIGITTNSQQLENQSLQILLQYIYVGIVNLLLSWLMMYTWILSGQRLANRCRIKYFTSLLTRKIEWYDLKNPGDIALEFQKSITDYEGAVGQKIPVLITTLCQVISTVILAMYFGWQLALIVCACFPVILLGGVIFGLLTTTKTQSISQGFNQANEIAYQALSSIKTVKSLNGEQYESKRFTKQLQNSTAKAIKYSFYSSMGTSLLLLIFYSCYGIGYIYSTYLLEQKVKSYGEVYTVRSIFIIFYAVFSNISQITKLQPCLSKINKGKEGYAKIKQMFQCAVPSHQNQFQFRGGLIRFQNVTFAYPKFPKKIVLKNLNLQFSKGSTSALVGESGCGKSTVMQLLLRYYEPTEGRITLNGTDIRQINVHCLRQQISYVGQQPILFSTTIRQNLLFGKPNASDQQLWKALEKANASEFVNNLSNKLGTYVGYGGDQLSGGQKQRIAIARAILKNSSILLFDEATSALDRQNQCFIEQTLKRVNQDSTTVSIAHRINSIRNCDQIYVIKEGAIEEAGKFNQLKYFVNSQIDNQQQYEINKPSLSIKHAQTNELKQAQSNLSTLIQKYSSTLYQRLFLMGLTDWPWMILLLFSSVVMSGTYPYFGILSTKMQQTYVKLQLNINDSEEVQFLRTQWFVLGIWVCLGTTVCLSVGYLLSENQSKRDRQTVYNKILNMPVWWHDRKQNNPNNLMVILSKECSEANRLIYHYAFGILMNVCCFIIGISLALWYEWRIALISLVLMPCSIVCRFIEMKYTLNINANTELYEQSSNFVAEAATNIKTIYSFNAQQLLIHRYQEILRNPFEILVLNSHKVGIYYGISVSLRFFLDAFTLYLGTAIINRYNVNYLDMIYSRNCIFFSAFLVGFSASYFPDTQVSKNAAAVIFNLLDQQDENQMQVREKSKLLKQLDKYCNKIEFNNVQFKYERRKELVLQDLSLQIKQNQKVALVGSSGCGKSTIMQLLIRYYQPIKGEILLSGQNLKDYDIHFLRSLFGSVSQQPVLFNKTIRENVIYNIEDAAEEEVNQALIRANIDKYQNINFEKDVGNRGSHISGGQKQRVAIARAILRKPQILLLDQATSALDSMNQKLVQKSLENIMTNKTSITIAHRLETIVNCDTICFMENGRIVQKGTYSQLTKKGEKFYLFEQGANHN